MRTNNSRGKHPAIPTAVPEYDQEIWRALLYAWQLYAKELPLLLLCTSMAHPYFKLRTVFDNPP